MRRETRLLIAALGVVLADLAVLVPAGGTGDGRMGRGAAAIASSADPPATASSAANGRAGTAGRAGDGSEAAGAGGEASTTAADWQPDPATYGVAVTDDIPIAMPDGRVLRAQLHEPTDVATGAPAPGPFPVILTETPYGKSVSGAMNDYLVRRGYIGVAVDVAGTGGSDGVSQLFGPDEAADSVQVIHWAGARPRSTGAVGMIGASYLAIDQLFAAAAVGPGSPLKAVFPVAVAADPYRDLFVSGGVVNAESPTGLIVSYAGDRTLTPLAERGPNDPVDALRLALEHGLQTVPFEGATFLDVMREDGRRFDGPYWRERAPERVLPDIVANDVAVYLVGGDYDVFQRGEPLLYSGLQNIAAGRDPYGPMVPGQPVSGKYQLLYGPWHHGDQGAGVDLNALQLQWFDQWLKGRDTGIVQTATPLHVIEPGGRRYDAATYPVETTQPQRLFLGSGGSLRADAPSAPSAADMVAFTGMSYPCSRSTVQWSAGLVPEQWCGGPRAIPGPLPGEVEYTSDPLASPLTLAGPIGVTLQARATTAETMWVVTLDDVAPDGSSTVLTAGAQLGSLRALDEHRSWPGAAGGWLLPYHPLTKDSQQPVSPGARTRYDIEIRPVFATLAPGHRLRVTVGTGDVPHLSPTPSEGVRLLGGVYSIEHDPAAPSFVELPVVAG